MEFQNGANNGHYSDQDVPLRALMRQLIEKFDIQAKQTERLNGIVLGDKEAGRDGLIHTVKKHGTYISTDKKMKWVGVGLAATTGATFWENLKHFFLR